MSQSIHTTQPQRPRCGISRMRNCPQKSPVCPRLKQHKWASSPSFDCVPGTKTPPSKLVERRLRRMTSYTSTFPHRLPQRHFVGANTRLHSGEAARPMSPMETMMRKKLWLSCRIRHRVALSGISSRTPRRPMTRCSEGRYRRLQCYRRHLIQCALYHPWKRARCRCLGGRRRSR